MGTGTRRLGFAVLALIATTAQGGETDHWAFIPPKRPALPAVAERSWVKNPIDAFILSRLEAERIHHAPPADRATLLRRLCFDLTGLPPEPEWIEAFLSDRSPVAYERLVDRLLASPHFGERAGQHWLDLARFAETDGFEFDQVRPNAWRYRDWVIRALNDDMPYDTVVRLQLAGDEARPNDPSALIATGFNRAYPDMVDLNDQRQRRQNALDDITETTGLVFLGLTLGCARCHDHKFDPIRQSEFFSLEAFFAAARFRDDFKLPASAGGGLAHGIDEAGPSAPTTYLLKRGDFSARGPEVGPGFPAVLCGNSKTRSAARPIATAHSTGRRTALADWLLAPENPLTARVMVNRIWAQHFGRGLVATPSDFGAMGDAPSHPELLDWLASEFVACGWSMKAIHRLIVTSATFQQASRGAGAEPAADPENALLWRQNRRRLDGETIRDALLAVSGSLSPKMHGPSVFPELPPELSRLSSKGAVWPVSPHQADRNRRSIYVFVRRNLRYPFFEVFDRPDTNVSCPQRARTTTAPQALSLMNSPLARQAAKRFAARVRQGAGTDPQSQIDRAVRLALGHPPDRVESNLLKEFLATYNSLEALGAALLNSNAFLFLD
jgi:hypothetical protein